METPLTAYKRIVSAQRLPSDEILADLLPRIRAGNDEALRELSAACLGICLEIVQTHYPDAEEGQTLDLLQEANAAMVGALKTFHGTTPAELAEHIEPAVLQHRIGNP
jgi:hypothetical protein